jgi:hypothetical protein
MLGVKSVMESQTTRGIRRDMDVVQVTCLVGVVKVGLFKKWKFEQIHREKEGNGHFDIEEESFQEEERVNA